MERDAEELSKQITAVYARDKSAEYKNLLA